MSTLDGKRVLVTRAANQAASICRLLEERGASPVVYPTVQIVPFENNHQLRGIFETWTSFDWVIFTSVNGVDVFIAEAKKFGFELTPQGEKPSIAAIGPATAKVLEESQLVVRLVPEEFVGEGLAKALGDVRGLKILLPRAKKARAVLPQQLEESGATVVEIPTYDTVHPNPSIPHHDLVNKTIDAFTFTSSSTVEGFLRLLGDRAIPMLTQSCVACIGPVTAQTARQNGVRVDVVAADYTTGGLVEALAHHFECR